MEVESALVTGANKGIGLEFVKQLVNLPKPPSFVFATYRDESTTQALKEIQDASKVSQVVLIKMDITKTEEIQSAQKIVEGKLGKKGLNLLINNAGVLKWQSFPAITEENMVSQFTTNAVGPVLVLKGMLPLLQNAASRKGDGMNVSRAAVLNISSKGGSIGEMTEDKPKTQWEALGYCTSKAALNMAMRVVALTVKDQGILIVNMCPGWVKTGMGSMEAFLTTEESVSSMLKTLSQLNETHHGTFMHRNGETIKF